MDELRAIARDVKHEQRDNESEAKKDRSPSLSLLECTSEGLRVATAPSISAGIGWTLPSFRQRDLDDLVGLADRVKQGTASWQSWQLGDPHPGRWTTTSLDKMNKLLPSQFYDYGYEGEVLYRAKQRSLGLGIAAGLGAVGTNYLMDNTVFRNTPRTGASILADIVPASIAVMALRNPLHKYAAMVGLHTAGRVADTGVNYLRGRSY